jgi:hypothetical protein
MAAADLNAVRAVIEGRLATELANAPAIPVVFHNMAYEPTPIRHGFNALSALVPTNI